MPAWLRSGPHGAGEGQTPLAIFFQGLEDGQQSLRVRGWRKFRHSLIDVFRDDSLFNPAHYIPHDAAGLGRIKDLLRRRDRYQQRLKGLGEVESTEALVEIMSELQQAQQQIELRFQHWIAVQNTIAIKERAIEFRRAGAISRRIPQAQRENASRRCPQIEHRDRFVIDRPV